MLWHAGGVHLSRRSRKTRGYSGGKDLVHLKFNAGDYADITVEVKSGGVDLKWYVQQLNRVISGEIERERAIPVDETLSEKVSSAPTAVPPAAPCAAAGARYDRDLPASTGWTVIRL